MTPVAVRSIGARPREDHEPGEDWSYDDRSVSVFAGPDLAAPRHHPASQTVPGPADRVPADWTERLR